MKKLFLSKIQQEINKHSYPDEVLSDRMTYRLPEPLQRYLNYCGYPRKPMVHNAKIVWRDLHFKRSLERDWEKMSCMQFNSSAEPCRIAYMKMILKGLVPFEGIDSYQDGIGNMNMRSLGLIPVANVSGAEMDESALVTVLSEALLIPNFIFQDFIQWKAIDVASALGTLTWNNVKVSGIFYFNEVGEFVHFMTADRYMSEKGGTFKKANWSACAENYQMLNGFKVPTHLRAIWHLKEGDVEYFNGDIAKITYNLKE